jgi:hypothetical protein
MKKLAFSIGLCFVLYFLNVSGVYGEQILTARKVDKAPLIDGVGSDAAWSKAKAITTYDKVAEIDIIIKAVYTDKKIFFLVTFPDKDESRTHRSWTWNKASEEYEQGKDREDVFVLKWNMVSSPVDLSVYADNQYTADIWFWKACRTDPSGYADDKIQRLSAEPQKKAREMISKSGKKMYLQRLGDQGDSAYKSTLHIEYKGDVLLRFVPKQSSLSRADIKAKGVWKAGVWTVEFTRAMVTGHDDDIQFKTKKTYQFGISRYEVAGREDEPDTTQPKYGTGDVSENLTLKFSSK